MYHVEIREWYLQKWLTQDDRAGGPPKPQAGPEETKATTYSE